MPASAAALVSRARLPLNPPLFSLPFFPSPFFPPLFSLQQIHVDPFNPSAPASSNSPPSRMSAVSHTSSAEAASAAALAAADAAGTLLPPPQAPRVSTAGGAVRQRRRSKSLAGAGGGSPMSRAGSISRAPAGQPGEPVPPDGLVSPTPPALLRDGSIIGPVPQLGADGEPLRRALPAAAGGGLGVRGRLPSLAGGRPASFTAQAMPSPPLGAAARHPAQLDDASPAVSTFGGAADARAPPRAELLLAPPTAVAAAYVTGPAARRGNALPPLAAPGVGAAAATAVRPRRASTGSSRGSKDGSAEHLDTEMGEAGWPAQQPAASTRGLPAPAKAAAPAATDRLAGEDSDGSEGVARFAGGAAAAAAAAAAEDDMAQPCAGERQRAWRPTTARRASARPRTARPGARAADDDDEYEDDFEEDEDEEEVGDSDEDEEEVGDSDEDEERRAAADEGGDTLGAALFRRRSTDSAAAPPSGAAAGNLRRVQTLQDRPVTADAAAPGPGALGRASTFGALSRASDMGMGPEEDDDDEHYNPGHDRRATIA